MKFAVLSLAFGPEVFDRFLAGAAEADKLAKNKNIMDKKIMDSDLLQKMIENMETDYYTFGAFTEYNDLDVKNLKNPLWESVQNKKR